MSQDPKIDQRKIKEVVDPTAKDLPAILVDAEKAFRGVNMPMTPSRQQIIDSKVRELQSERDEIVEIQNELRRKLEKSDEPPSRKLWLNQQTSASKILNHIDDLDMSDDHSSTHEIQEINDGEQGIDSLENKDLIDTVLDNSTQKKKEILKESAPKNYP